MPSDLKISAEVRNAIEDLELFGEESLYISRVEENIKKGSSLSKQGQLEALYTRYGNCQNCALGSTRKKIVFGTGSLDFKVLAIGEGPGYEEDRQGLPFVGKAGVLLDKILASINLDRKTNVYIANIVKCHPMRDPAQPDLRGNDRAPTPEEMFSCRPILDQQIEILQPPLILCLGSVAAKNLLNSSQGVSQLRGKVYDFAYPVSGKKVPLLVTYHPAALLRNELLKKDVWHDMKVLRDLIAKL